MLFKFFQTKKIYRSILKWFLINTAASSFIFLIQLQAILGNPEIDPVFSYFHFFFSFQIISSLCVITGHHISQFYQDKPYLLIFLYMLPFTLLTALFGTFIVISFELFFSLYDLTLENVLLRLNRSAPSTSIITVIMSLIFSRIGYLEFNNKLLEKKRSEDPKVLESISRENISSEKYTDGISLKEEENYFLVPYNDIVYLSAHNKVTVIHGLKRDYRTPRLLKEITEKLPENKFMRVHKSFVVNISKISHIQYFMGGSYLAYLKDEDETNLPVGKKFAPVLKRRLGI